MNVSWANPFSGVLYYDVIKCSRFVKSKENLYYTCGITLKRVTSVEAHLSGLAPGLYHSDETSHEWRAVGDAVENLNDMGIEPQTSRTDIVVLNNRANQPVYVFILI